MTRQVNPNQPDPSLTVGTRVRDPEGYEGTIVAVSGDSPFTYRVHWDGDTYDFHGAHVLEPVSRPRDAPASDCSETA